MNGGLSAGERFGDFEIHGLAGEGGMGMVYRATQISLGRVVALKVISPEIANSADFRTRFEHESRLAASIDHPHVVSIFAAGEQDGQAYIAMQWIDGISLDEAIAPAPLSADRAVVIASQMAGALDAAHATGLLHRDIKPANILVRTLGGQDHAYLTDFGVAKRTEVGATGLTKTGHIIGTLSYMAPEQIRGEPGDARSDLYSLGCVLFECLTGRAPFERSSEVATMWAHVNDPRPKPSEVRPELGTAFDPVIERALAIEPEDRFGSGSELAASANAALRGIAPPGETVAASPGPTVAATAAEPETAAPAPPPPPPRHDAAAEAATARIPPEKKRRFGAGAAVAALVLAAGIGVGAFAATGGFSSGDTTITSTGDAASSSTPSSSTSATTTGPTDAQDRRAITGVLHNYEAFYSNHELTSLASILTEDVTRHGFSFGSCGVQTGKHDVLAAYSNQFDNGSGAYALTDLSPSTVEVSGDSATSGQLNYTITGGSPGTVTFDLQRSASGWRISQIDASC